LLVFPFGFFCLLLNFYFPREADESKGRKHQRSMGLTDCLSTGG